MGQNPQRRSCISEEDGLELTETVLQKTSFEAPATEEQEGIDWTSQA
jgi:hypothetical protein